jgi:hypothetical protein
MHKIAILKVFQSSRSYEDDYNNIVSSTITEWQECSTEDLEVLQEWAYKHNHRNISGIYRKDNYDYIILEQPNPSINIPQSISDYLELVKKEEQSQQKRQRTLQENKKKKQKEKEELERQKFIELQKKYGN